MKASSIIPVIKFENTGLPFKIQTLQWVHEFQEELNELPHSHDHFEMTWIVKGSGTCWIDLQKQSVKDNQLLCTRPGQVHRLIMDKAAEGYVLSFKESFLTSGEHEFDWTSGTSLFRLFSEAKTISLPENQAEDMKELAEKMIREFNNLYAFRSQILCRYLKIFLLYLGREFEEMLRSAKQTRNTELVQHFLELVEKNFNQKKMVADYAQLLSVTPNYLNEIIKKSTGYPAGYHIRQRVVLEAKRMGMYSGICMKEIAYNLGFADSAHFSKFFKVVTGTNFSEFKKERQTMSIAV